jgi:hypothetical protein
VKQNNSYFSDTDRQKGGVKLLSKLGNNNAGAKNRSAIK